MRMQSQAVLHGIKSSKGDYDKAIAYYEQALDILSKRLGRNHPNTETVADNLKEARTKLLASKP